VQPLVWTRTGSLIRPFVDFAIRILYGMNQQMVGSLIRLIDLAQAVTTFLPQQTGGKPLVVCTGGEPLLQLDVDLIRAFHDRGFEVAVEQMEP